MALMATPRKKPNRTGKPVNVWLPDRLHAQIQAYLAAQTVPPRITDLVEVAIVQFLQSEGFWPPPAK